MASTTHNDLRTALNVYTWASIEAKNILRCISIAVDHGEAVDDDLRPAIGIAVDGVVRLLAYVERQFEHIDTSAAAADPAAAGGEA